MNQQEQNKTAENNTQGPPPTATGQDDVKKMNVNPNPRANENVYDEDSAEKGDTSGVGSEITDGEAG